MKILGHRVCSPLFDTTFPSTQPSPPIRHDPPLPFGTILFCKNTDPCLVANIFPQTYNRLFLGWQRHAIESILKRALLPQNLLAVRKIGIRLFLLWYQSLAAY